MNEENDQVIKNRKGKKKRRKKLKKKDIQL